MDLETKERLRLLREEAWYLKHAGTISFPKEVKPTKCRTKTNTVLMRTPHGVIRKEVRVTIAELLPLSEYKLHPKGKR